MDKLISFPGNSLPRLFAIFVSILTFLVSPLLADELGMHLLSAIEKNPKGNYSDATLLLLTRDLGWYEKNMDSLPIKLQNRIQDLRVRIVGEATKNVAEAMGEPASVFLASGSCKPGRDIDLLYMGKDTARARREMEQAVAAATKDILAQADNDELLKAARKKFPVPASLSTNAMEVVTSDLPNFAFDDLAEAYQQARAAKKAGQTNAAEIFQQRLHEALKKNFDAQVFSSGKDMYRGAAGQRFFILDYLSDENKIRWLAQNSKGQWAFKPGGPQALSDALLNQVLAMMPSSRRAKFAKIASEYAMFYQHGEGGIGGTAKYVDRIWGDVDEAALFLDMEAEEFAAIVTARQVAQDPSSASAILAKAGLSETQVREGVKNALKNTVQSQLHEDVGRLLDELNKIQGDKAIDDLEALFRKQHVTFDLNDLANGLAALGDIDDEGPTQILEQLSRKFGNTPMGDSVIAYIKRQMNLIGDKGNKITYRLLKFLKDNGDIPPTDYYTWLRRHANDMELPEGVTKKLNQARHELLLLSSVNSLDLKGNPASLDDLITDWKRQRSNALIDVITEDIRKIFHELSNFSADDLLALGWLNAELKLPMQTRQRLKLATDQVAQLGQKLGQRMQKNALSLVAWQKKQREYIFSLAPTEFGEPGDLGGMDVVFAAASGLLQTYTILNSSPPMSPEDEQLALENAWVTSLPIVGDFAEGFNAGIDAHFTGNKRKALEAGLFVTIGVMGVVPGGQIPAMVTGLVSAGLPIAEGVYDASQAQNLIRAWIASGDWEAGGDKGPVLKGLFDRAHVHHEITFNDLLSTAGDVPYEAEIADGLFSVPTMAGSIRAYAEQYVIPQHKNLLEQRETLKSLFRYRDPLTWEKYFDVTWEKGEGDKPLLKYSRVGVEVAGGKVARLLFERYQLALRQVLVQTLQQLKLWAEEERRVARDYEAEVNKIKQQLKALQTELKVSTLVTHAQGSADAYSKVIKNVMEKESLPLSRYRIYQHYLKQYQQVAAHVRRVKAVLKEIPSGYQPSRWFLTGYPEFDLPRVRKLDGIIVKGKDAARKKIEELLDTFGFKSKRGFDPLNQCHKQAFEILAAKRYKVSFIENLVDYYETLAANESAWSDAYNAAKSRYLEVQKSMDSVRSYDPASAAAVELVNAVVTFTASMPYALASGERELYRSTASDYKVRLQTAMREFERASWMTGEAGKVLETCLVESIRMEISLDPLTPEKGKTTIAQVEFASGSNKPASYYWFWELEGELKSKAPYGKKIEVEVNGPGVVTAMLGEGNLPESARRDIIARQSMRVVPIEATEDVDKDDAKEKDDKDAIGDIPKDISDPDKLAAVINALKAERNWQGLAELLSRAKKAHKQYKPHIQLEREGAVSKALQELKWERQVWLVKWNEYLKTLQRLSDRKWGEIYRKMEQARDKVQQKCHETCEDCDKQCSEKAWAYYDNCVGQLKKDHNAESARIKNSLNTLAPIVERLDAGGYEHTRWFKEVEALSDKHGLPFPYPDPVVTRIQYVTQCVETEAESKVKIDDNVLTVSLNAPTTVVEVSTPVTVSATIGGGKSPYQYRWEGAVGSGTSAQLTPTHIGDWSVSLQVTDSEGITGTAVTTVRVGPGKLAIKGLKADVIYGSESPLNAWGMGLKSKPLPAAKPYNPCDGNADNPFCVDTVTVTKSTSTPREAVDLPPGTIVIDYHPDEEDIDSPAPESDLQVIWQSEPRLTFDPVESIDGNTRVTFDRVGEVKVWCELHEKIEGVFQTVGECEQQTIRVGPPAFAVSYQPDNGKAHVGQKVTAQIHSNPPVDAKLVDFRWFDPASSNRRETSINGSKIEFTVRDLNPVKLKALARVPTHGDELGEVKSSYTGASFGLKAWMVQPPSLPQTWDTSKGGLVTIERNQRATGELITLNAELQGGAIPDSLRWTWTVNDGTTISNPNVQTPTVSRSHAGSIIAKVIAKDKNGLKLGQASVTVEVVEIMSAPAQSSKQSLNQSKTDTKKASIKQQLQKLDEQIKKSLSRADFKAAEKSVAAMKKVDKKQAAKAAAKVVRAAVKSGWRAAHQRNFDVAIENLEVANRLNPKDKDAKNKLAKARRFKKAWPAIVAKKPAFDRLIAEKKPYSAYQAMLQIQKMQFDMPGQMANPFSQQITKAVHEAMEEMNQHMRGYEQRNKTFFVNNNWQAMLENAQATAQRELSEANRLAVEGSIKLAKQMLAEERNKTGSPLGKWSYQSGNFKDEFEVHADGRVTSKVDPSNTGAWSMKGDHLVIRWKKNGWTNSYKISAKDKHFTGTDTEPNGTVHRQATLSRIGLASEETVAGQSGDKAVTIGESEPPARSSPKTSQVASTVSGFDFESGNLNGWTVKGEAFKYQPTYGDNPTARNRGQASNHAGQYWIGTYEKRQKPADPAGAVQGDGPTGSILSAPFKLTSSSIDFLIGGGCNLDLVRIELVIDGEATQVATGKCNETMRRETWDVSRYMGKTAQIRIVDDATGGWGHINVDDIRLTDSKPSTPKPSTHDNTVLFDFESGHLKGWSQTGQAFQHQPTFGDNPTARGRGQKSNHQGNYWTGTYERRQKPSDKAGGVQGDGPKGILRSPAFTITGSKISFLVGGGCNANVVRVELSINGAVVHKSTGKCNETMQRQTWDVSKYQGRTAKINMVDVAGGSWGHINADDFRYVE